MKLVVIFGPAAAGKMTVGIELQKLTGYKLFHNHMVSELIYNFYGYKDKQFGRLNSEFRTRLFEEFAKSDFPGIIFTYVWALDQEDDHAELKKYMMSLGVAIEDVFFVELEAEQKVRLVRNRSELRLREKKSKNNFEESEGFIYYSESNFRLNTDGEFFYPGQHIKIDNTNQSPERVAGSIKSELALRKFI